MRLEFLQATLARKRIALSACLVFALTVRGATAQTPPREGPVLQIAPVAPSVYPVGYSGRWIEDSEFVYGPALLNFDVKAYLATEAPHLSQYSEFISHWCGYHSISPKVLLTVLEMRSGLVTTSATAASLANPLAGLLPGTTFEEQVQTLLAVLSRDFYVLRAALPRRADSGGINGATFALLNVFRATAAPEAFAGFVEPERERFRATYTRLFPSDKPLGASPGEPGVSAVPPANMLQMPWKLGQSWYFNGVHTNTGTDPGVLASIDLTRTWSLVWGDNTSTDYVVAAFDGTVTVFSSCQVRVTSSTGWATNYYHLDNIVVANGANVTANQTLATYANNLNQALCQGGSSTGPHVHFTLLNNGAFSPLDGVTLGGFTVHSGRYSYDSDPAYMWLSRGGTKYFAYEVAIPSTLVRATGSLLTSRVFHRATVLANDKVLITGGGNPAYVSASELYDPGTGAFSATGSLATARFGHTSTRLSDGTVLVAGGARGQIEASAELYSPTSGTFSLTGTLANRRFNHAATLLTDGTVLVTGGDDGGAISDSELYHPAGGVFGTTGGLANARSAHTATRLMDGKVLVAGGAFNSGAIASAELYDPVSGTFSPTGSLATPRMFHTATLLADGRVLIAGGRRISPIASAEIYDPASGMFSSTGSLGTARELLTATLLPDGKVLIAGGQTIGGGYLSSLETFDPVTATFTAEASNLFLARYGHTATLLKDGNVLIAGGYNGSWLSSAELYPPTLDHFPPPLFFSATATTASHVALTWLSVPDATSYEVYRSSLNSPYTLVSTTAGTSLDDGGLDANKTYLYKVRAVGSGGPSAFTAIDPATTTLFQDTSLSGLPVKAVHVTQLRAAVNAMRAAAGLPAAAFADATPVAGSTMILRQHLIELRTALDEARSTLALAPITYTNSTIAAGSTVIQAAHLLELRAGTQ
jgi:hypothetical protein